MSLNLAETAIGKEEIANDSIPPELMNYESYIKQQISSETLAWWNNLRTIDYNGMRSEDSEWVSAVNAFWDENQVGRILPECFRGFLLGADCLPSFLWLDESFARRFDPFLHQNVGPFWLILLSYTAPRGRIFQHNHCCSCNVMRVKPFSVNLPATPDYWLEMVAVEIMEQWQGIASKKKVPNVVHK